MHHLISIIDYGVGNLRSVEKAFSFLGFEAVVSSDPKVILSSDAVVLPGVGAFADAMKNLENAGMISVIKETIAQNKPFLGICLGMQLLFQYSEEGEAVPGLGVLKGGFKRIPDSLGLKIPHMGWNKLEFNKECSLFSGIHPNPYVYFVHSYYLADEEKEIVSATVDYGIKFGVAICRGNLFATQFHPEKSSNVGLSMLKNFANAI